MPKIGFKVKMNNLRRDLNETFIIVFDLKYRDSGFLTFNNEKNEYFDCGDCRILLDKVVASLTDDVLKKYDNGVYILSICKYLVDKIPNIYSIQYESISSKDTYLRKEIIDDYNRILKKNIEYK